MVLGSQNKNGILYSSPSGPLPQEMMAEIFFHCVQSDVLGDYSPHPSLPPLSLTWVCQYWRQLALSMPKLWTKISLGVRGTDPSNDARLLDIWTKRAGPRKPMHINLCHEMNDSEQPVFFNPSRGERYIVGMKILTDKLITLKNRWETLELHALDLYVLNPVFNALLDGAPQLKTLSISTKYFDFFGSVHFIDLSGCPALQSLRLLCPMLCPTASSSIASNMTDLEIRFCPLMRDCLTWLNICPNLQRLNVRFFKAISSSLPREQSPLILPQLKFLTISCFSDDSDPSPLLDLLQLPALREFSLDMNGLVLPALNQTWSTRMLGIIKRSAATIEHLTLLGTPMTSDALIQLLEETLMLKELVLSGSAISDQVLKSFALSGKTPLVENGGLTYFALCPILESLELREFDCHLDSLVSTIYLRCRTAGRVPAAESVHDIPTTENPGFLKNLTLIWSPHVALPEHPLISECVAGGLELVNRAYNGDKLFKVRIIPDERGAIGAD